MAATTAANTACFMTMARCGGWMDGVGPIATPTASPSARTASSSTSRPSATRPKRYAKVNVTWRGMLDALPEHVAVLDERGVIDSVNEPWRRFADANGIPAAAVSAGADYLAVCRRGVGLGRSGGRRSRALARIAPIRAAN